MFVDPHSVLHISFPVILVSRTETASVQRSRHEVKRCGGSGLRSLYDGGGGFLIVLDLLVFPQLEYTPKVLVLIYPRQTDLERTRAMRTVRADTHSQRE